MYKVILVDDEKIVRLALKTIIDWESMGFTVTGSYGSAGTALREISDDPPDLIITDIRMPDMDGLQFIQRVRERELNCPIIVLTNHENFSYAVEAIRQGVMDYVVKTDISPERLTELIQKAKLRLSERARGRTGLPTGLAEDDFRLMRQSVHGESPRQALFSEAYILCLAFLDCPLGSQERNDAGFYNLLCEKLGRPVSTLFSVGADQTAIIFCPKEMKRFVQESEALCRRISGFARSYLNRPCGFLLSEQFADIAGFRQELDRCRAAIPYVNFHGAGRLTWVATLKRLSESPVAVQPVCRQIQQRLEKADYTGARGVFVEFSRRELLHAAASGPAAIAMQSVNLLTLLDCSACLSPIERDSLWKQLNDCSCLDDYEVQFNSVIQLAQQNSQRLTAFFYKKNLTPIIEYIKENLTQHISLSMISAAVHMSENYISRLFKSETGMNIISFINLMKMEQARRMLCLPNCTVRTVAGDLGYYESSYFIKLFRRVYGIGPGEYKKFVEDYVAAPLLEARAFDIAQCAKDLSEESMLEK